MIQVYISSTYEDLKEYRAAVDDVLRDLRFHVVSMEHYTASDQRPLDECLADVAACDLYLGLYAWRYGYVPEDPNKNPDQESITVLEYRKARSEGIPTLIFLLDDNAPWPPGFVDAGSKSGDSRIAKFRQELRRERVVSTFSTKEELMQRVLTSVFRWAGPKVEISNMDSPVPQGDAKEAPRPPFPSEKPPDGRTGIGDLDSSVSWGVTATRAHRSPTQEEASPWL